MIKRFVRGRGRGRGRGKTSVLGALRGLIQNSGFDPAVLPIKTIDQTQKYSSANESASSGSTQDGTVVPVNVCTEAVTAGHTFDSALTKSAAESEAVAFSRVAGFLYGGSSTSDETNPRTAIDKLAFGTLSVSTISATAVVSRSHHTSGCSLDNGYFVSGMDETLANVTSIDKFVIASETASANSASTTYFHREGCGFETLNGVFTAGGYMAGSMGYVCKINPSTDAVTDTYIATMFANQHQYGPAAVSDGNTYGYVCGGWDDLDTDKITRIDTSSTTASDMSAVLGATKTRIMGVSSKTKGYIAGYDTASDLFTFSSETRAAGGTTYAASYSYASAMAGADKGFFVGGYDTTTTVGTILSVAFASDTWTVETAALGTARSMAAGIDAQMTTSGGSADVTDGTTGSPVNGMKECSGSARGFLSGSINAYTLTPRGIIGILDFGTETITDMPYPTYSTGADRRRTSGLQSGATGYFCGGFTSGSYSTQVRSFGILTYAQATLSATVNGSTYDAGVDGDTYGILANNPAYPWSSFTYSTETMGSVTAVYGVGVAGFGWNGKAYFAGGMAAGTAVGRFTFASSTYATLGATLPAARWESSAMSLAGSGFFAGGADSGRTAFYATVSGFLESSEASRTTSAALGEARCGCAGLSAYTKGYVAMGTGGSGRPLTQKYDSLVFATETAAVTSIQLGMIEAWDGAYENGGLSYRPATGIGALDTSYGTGSMGVAQTTSTTAVDTTAATTAFPSARSEATTADNTQAAVQVSYSALVEAGSAADSPSATYIVLSASSESGTANTSQLVFGTDVSIPEPATAGNTQSVWAAFSGVDNEALTAVDTKAATALFASAQVEVSTVSESLIGSIPRDVDASAAATATETDAGAVFVTADIAQDVTATDTEAAGIYYSGAGVEAATATTAQDYSVFVIGSAVAAATTAQDAHAVVVNVSVVEAGTASHSNVAFAVLWDSVAGSTTATTQQSNVLRTTAAVVESATPGHQQQAIASFSTVTLEQASALDTAFATGVLTAAAAEALAAIVSAYAVIAGEVIDKQSVFIVSRENKEFVLSGENAQYVVSVVDSEFVMHTVGKAFVLSSDGDNVVVKDDAGRNSIIVKGGGNG